MSTAQHAAVELFSTSILSNHKVRSRHERYISILSVKKVPFVYHDLASDEEAKSRWRRKARDPQIPGLLVHNEWRGTFEEFEESVEFGELDLFLKIDPQRAQEGVAPVVAPAQASLGVGLDSSTSIGDTSAASISSDNSKSLPRATSHSVKPVARLAQPRAPSQTTLAPALPFAPSGSGFRKDHDAESFLNSLGISDLNLTEEELNEILEEGAKSSSVGDKSASSDEATQGNSSSGGKYPSSLGLGTSKPAVQRTYIPSAEAGVKPLRLARMGNDNQRSATTSFSSSSSSSVSPLRPSPSARYNSTHLSSKALAAEAQASISSRSFSSVKLREAVSRGDKLEDAFKTTRAASSTDEKEQVVGREDLDDLMASLGLNNVEMTEEEAEAFLLDGSIPSGLDSYGSRLKRQGSVADRARTEAAAREVVKKAKEKGYGSRTTSEAGSPQTDSGSFANTNDNGKGLDAQVADAFKPHEEQLTGSALASDEDAESKKDKADTPMVLPTDEDESLHASQDTPRMGTVGLLPSEGDRSIDFKSKELGSSDSVETKKTLEAAKTPTQASLDSAYEGEFKDNSKGDEEKDKTAVVASEEGPKAEVEDKEEATKLSEPVDNNKESMVQPDKEIFEGAIATSSPEEPIAASSGAATSTFPVESEVMVYAKDSSTADAKTALPSATTLLEEEEKKSKGDVEKEAVEEPDTTTPPTSTDPPPDFELASPTTIPSSPSAAAPFSSSSPMGSASLLPVQDRRPSPIASPKEALTPSRRAMDLTRSSSSNSVTSDSAARLPQIDSSVNLAASPIVSPRGSDSGHNKSPRNGPKKFFSLGRKKGGGGRSSSNSKRGEEDGDVDENGFDVGMSPTAMSPSSSSLDPGYKRISAILREADEALEGLGDGSLDISHDSIMSGHAFDYDLDEVAEDVPKEVIPQKE